MPRAQNGRKICSKCRVEKPVKEFYARKDCCDGLRSQCKSCYGIDYETHRTEILIKRKLYNKTHKAEKSDYDTVYYRANKAKKAARQKAYEQERLKTDFRLRLIHNIRSLIRASLKNRGFRKNGTKTVQILGMSLEDFCDYFESKFTSGMNWEEVMKGNIHIDHIIPISSAKTKADVIRLCHYTNLQPLWAIDNRRKGARW